MKSIIKTNRRKRTRNKNTLKRRTQYQNRKQGIIDLLGGQCVTCGTRQLLTFDHIHGRDWDITAVHSTKRLRIYREEAEAGLIQLLCNECNARKGKPGPADFDPNEYGSDF